MSQNLDRGCYKNFKLNFKIKIFCTKMLAHIVDIQLIQKIIE